MMLELTQPEISSLKTTNLKWLALMVEVYSRVHKTPEGLLWRFNMVALRDDLNMVNGLIEHNTPDTGADLLRDYLRNRSRKTGQTLGEIFRKLEASGKTWAIKIASIGKEVCK